MQINNASISTGGTQNHTQVATKRGPAENFSISALSPFQHKIEASWKTALTKRWAFGENNKRILEHIEYIGYKETNA